MRVLLIEAVDTSARTIRAMPSVRSAAAICKHPVFIPSRPNKYRYPVPSYLAASPLRGLEPLAAAGQNDRRVSCHSCQRAVDKVELAQGLAMGAGAWWRVRT